MCLELVYMYMHTLMSTASPRSPNTHAWKDTLTHMHAYSF